MHAYQRATGLYTLNLLFDSNVELDDIYKEMGKDPVYKALAHNRKIWQPSGILPQPLDERVLDQVQTADSLPVVFTSDNGDYWTFRKEQDDQFRFSAFDQSDRASKNSLSNLQEPSYSVPFLGARAPSCKEIAYTLLSGEARVRRSRHLLALSGY